MISKYLIILFFLTWMAYLDIRYRQVPNELISALLLTSIPYIVLEKDLVLRVILVIGFFIFFIFSFDWISGVIGGADLKILAVLLLVLPLSHFYVTLVVSQIVLLGYAIGRRNLKIKVPYFAFQWAGMLLMITFKYHNVIIR
jgi:Flp pilus assembly protein protease CpaA